MATRLARYAIAESLKLFDELFARDVPRQFHTAITSSLTKCSLTSFGAPPSSKWHCTASRIRACSCARSSASVKMDSPSARARVAAFGRFFDDKNDLAHWQVFLYRY